MQIKWDDVWPIKLKKIPTEARKKFTLLLDGFHQESLAVDRGEGIFSFNNVANGGHGRVGHALGFDLESIRNQPAAKWVAAAEGDAAALEEIEGAMVASGKRATGAGRPSTGQDIVKGRRTEIDFINGLVAAKGKEVGVPAPTHEALTELVRRVERGDIEPSPDHVANL